MAPKHGRKTVADGIAKAGSLNKVCVCMHVYVYFVHNNYCECVYMGVSSVCVCMHACVCACVCIQELQVNHDMRVPSFTNACNV